MRRGARLCHLQGLEAAQEPEHLLRRPTNPVLRDRPSERDVDMMGSVHPDGAGTGKPAIAGVPIVTAVGWATDPRPVIVRSSEQAGALLVECRLIDLMLCLHAASKIQRGSDEVVLGHPDGQQREGWFVQVKGKPKPASGRVAGTLNANAFSPMA